MSTFPALPFDTWRRSSILLMALAVITLTVCSAYGIGKPTASSDRDAPQKKSEARR